MAGRPWAEHRLLINGMFRGLCSGVPWHDLPERQDQWTIVDNSFNRWRKSGVINIIFNKLFLFSGAYGLVDWSARRRGMTVISAHSDVQPGRKKTSPISPEITARGALAVVMLQNPPTTNGNGLPLNIVPSPGLAHESQFAQYLLNGIGVQRQNGGMKRCGHALFAVAFFFIRRCNCYDGL